jgi:hypothetical protein
MDLDLPQTTEALGGARVNQFSIFTRNKVGAMLDLVRLLNDHHVEVLATNVETSADTALVRVVVSDPETIEGIFHLHQIPYSVSPLVVVELDGAFELGALLAALLAAEVNIFGSYALLTQPRGKPALALHVEDNDCAVDVLKNGGFTVLNQSDISR